MLLLQRPPFPEARAARQSAAQPTSAASIAAAAAAIRTIRILVAQRGRAASKHDLVIPQIVARPQLQHLVGRDRAQRVRGRAVAVVREVRAVRFDQRPQRNGALGELLQIDGKTDGMKRLKNEEVEKSAKN